MASRRPELVNGKTASALSVYELDYDMMLMTLLKILSHFESKRRLKEAMT